MTSWLNWEISDDAGTNPLGHPADFEFRIEYDYDPGDPGYMYDSNGDGYPASNPAINLTVAVCEYVCAENEQKRAPTQEEAEAIADWFWTELDKRPEIRDQIRAFGFEQMELEPDWDDLDD